MSDLRHVGQTVIEVRRGWMRRETASTAIAVAAGVVSLVLAAQAIGLFAVGMGAVAVATGVGAAAAAAVRVVRRGLGEPTEMDVAVWIEEALPELRESLVTAMERGPLAEHSAAYAAERLRAVPGADKRVFRARGRRPRLHLLAASLTAVLLGLFSVVLSGGHRRAAGVGKPTREIRPPARVEVIAIRGPTKGLDAHDGLFEVVASGGSPLPASPDATAVDAADILLSTPYGFERAVELFVTGGSIVGRSRPRPGEGRR